MTKDKKFPLIIPVLYGDDIIDLQFINSPSHNVVLTDKEAADIAMGDALANVEMENPKITGPEK